MKSAEKVAIVLKGYPRLSETFIAQEMLGLQRLGLDFSIVSLRHPTDKKRHPVHEEITADVSYLPEYLHQEFGRVFSAWLKVRKLPGYRNAFGQWWKDLKRDFTRNRLRRFGQSLVMAAELDEGYTHLYAHFLHTPASVTRYAAMIRQLPWSCSAHAKDIWTSPDWEKQEKLADMEWLVTCTSYNTTHLKGLAANPDKVELMYHGLDLTRFPKTERTYSQRDGSDADNPVEILSVGRAVPKKGYDVLLQALAGLPKELHWRFKHIGGGSELKKLQAQATELGIEDGIEWQGACDQSQVLEAYHETDFFVLMSRVTEDGDRDGLPNVIVEAQSQGLPVLSTNISAIPELIVPEENGLLVSSESVEETKEGLLRLIQSPGLRQQFGETGQDKVHSAFSFHHSILQLANKFGLYGGEQEEECA